MRPVTVTVGPLGAASANNICTSQTPAAGKPFFLNGTLGTAVSNSISLSQTVTGATAVLLNGALGGAAIRQTGGTGAFLSTAQNITITSAGNDSGIKFTIVGLDGNGAGLGETLAGTNAGTAVSVNQYRTIISVTTTGSTASTITVGQFGVVTLDTPRRILLTPSGNESSNSFTITGTGWNNEIVTEVLAGGNVTATYSAMDYRTVTQIVGTNTAAGSLTVGTNGIASSQWVRLDEYAPPSTSIQVTVTGTVNFTLQQTIQDVNSPFANVSPYQVTWINSADPAMVAATQSAQSSYTYSPLWAKMTLNSGTGSISATFSQNASSSF